jgi:GNAT superfamily N-acetyltransferase
VDGSCSNDDVTLREVRLARPGEEEQICDVCRLGFEASSQGLLTPATIERQARTYYTPERVRREIVSAGEAPAWQGYVVAVSRSGAVLGAAGGGVLGRTTGRSAAAGQVLVLYVRLPLRGQGVGSALLDFVTAQQRQAGATEQWVSVTEGNDLGIPFYRARGFVERERVPFVTGEDGRVEAHSLRMSRAI